MVTSVYCSRVNELHCDRCIILGLMNIAVISISILKTSADVAENGCTVICSQVLDREVNEFGELQRVLKRVNMSQSAGNTSESGVHETTANISESQCQRVK